MHVTESPRFVNPLLHRLRADKPCIGLLVTMPSVPLTQILADAGFDWLFIDMEHGPLGIESAHAMIAATAGTACAPVVRVPANVPWLLKPVLDAGAMGAIVPMVRTVEDVEQAVHACRYPPHGTRGWGPFYAPLRWGMDARAYVEVADEEVMTVVLIEHPDAVHHIREIVRVPGLDVAVIAPFDLAMNLGRRDGPEHPDVQAAIAEAEAAIRESDVHLGGVALSAAQANAMIARGYRLLTLGFDARLLQSAAAELLTAIDRNG